MERTEGGEVGWGSEKSPPPEGGGVDLIFLPEGERGGVKFDKVRTGGAVPTSGKHEGVGD